MSTQQNFKPCKPHQYRDPSTNRCKNNPDYDRARSVKPSKSRRKGATPVLVDGYKPCKPHQYRDPVTHRCKNKADHQRVRSTKPSKSRRKSPVSKGPASKGYKPCNSHQVRDPVTHRCKNKPEYKRIRSVGGADGGGTPKGYKPCNSHQVRDPVTHRCKNKPDYKRHTPKRTPAAAARVTPDERWEYSKKVIGGCIRRSKLPLRDLQIKVVQYMDDHDSILVMHGTGTGKTLTAITTSQCYLDQYPDRRVVFVGPASLATNFKKELVRYGLQSMDKYSFYSFDKFFLETKAGRPIDLSNSFLVVDEVHNLRNPQSKKSKAVVEASWGADKRMLLSATPFVNNLEDFIPLINMLYMRNIIGTRTDFYDGLCAEWISKNTTQENLTTLKYLMRDKVDVVFNNDNENFPERIDHTLEVPMTDDYYTRYTRIVQGENIYGILFQNPNKFYNGYRRAVNKAGPGYYSMKVKAALPMLLSGKTIVYTNWIEFGIGPTTDALKEAGLSYRIFSGDVKMDQRQSIVDDFNNDRFQVLVLTKAGGEGLDLKGVKSVVVMDPTWNDSGLQQIIGRAIRYKSHSHLPVVEQKVDVYFMVLTKPFNVGTDEALPSGDVLLYGIIEKKNELNSAIVAILEDMSI